MLRCAYCGTVREVPAGPTPPHPGERSLAEGLRLAAQPSANPGARELLCSHCGAAVELGTAEAARTCAFCGTASVAPTQSDGRALRTDSVLPFAIEKRVAEQAFSRWLHRLWLRPTDLRHLAELDPLRGAYVPFWIFAAQVESQWSAESGRHYYVDEDQLTILGGRDDSDSGSGGADPRGDSEPGVLGGPELPRPRSRQRVRKTRWRSVSGWRTDVHRDVLVGASSGLGGAQADRLGTFNLRRLVPYADGYLAGFAAESHATELSAGHARARRQLDATQQELCARDIEGDTHRNLVIRNRYSEETFRYALLPVWIATYRYRARIYRFVVSGQTGEVIGQAPYSRLKVALSCALGLATLLLLLYLWHGRPDVHF